MSAGTFRYAGTSIEPDPIVAAVWPDAVRTPGAGGVDWLAEGVLVARWDPYTRDVRMMERVS